MANEREKEGKRRSFSVRGAARLGSHGYLFLVDCRGDDVALIRATPQPRLVIVVYDQVHWWRWWWWWFTR
jgi:hypothetical protein